MAHASGRVSDLHLPDGQVRASTANVVYSIKWTDTGPQLGYRKTTSDGATLEGDKVLRYYIGSGTHGRGFIFEEQGQPFETPVAYFGANRGWDVAPGYEKETSIFLGRKVESACLSCHSSGAKSKENELFEEGAISCERCHGPGEAHVNAMRTGMKTLSSAIINPAKLTPEKRDSICAQCHLTGETRVLKPGQTEFSFRPGDALEDHIVPFVWTNPDRSEFKVVGHFEGLWQSKCKRSSGDRLSCLTCHDPHVQVTEANKAAYYRQKCLGCHETSSCRSPKEARAQNNDSCIACHMQKRVSTDGQHTAFTDHWIRRFAETQPQSSRSLDLTAFWPEQATKRDYALADADEAWQHGDSAAFEKVHAELEAVLPGTAKDANLLAQLAYTDDLSRQPAKAEKLYQEALAADPENLLALTNLGTHLAMQGDFGKAIELWQKAVAINPGLQASGLNLARALWRQGHQKEAIETVRKTLSLYPDSQTALELLKEMQP